MCFWGTGHWQQLGLHAGWQQLVGSLPTLESVCSRLCGWFRGMLALVLRLIWSEIRVSSLCLNHSVKCWLLHWELMWDHCPAEESTTDGDCQLKRIWFKIRSFSMCIYSRLYIFTVAMWQWPGVRTAVWVCHFNDEGDFGSHLECCRALCWRSCILLLLAVSSRPQALH